MKQNRRRLLLRSLRKLSNSYLVKLNRTRRRSHDLITNSLSNLLSNSKLTSTFSCGISITSTLLLRTNQSILISKVGYRINTRFRHGLTLTFSELRRSGLNNTNIFNRLRRRRASRTATSGSGYTTKLSITRVSTIRATNSKLNRDALLGTNIVTRLMRLLRVSKTMLNGTTIGNNTMANRVLTMIISSITTKFTTTTKVI